MAIGACFLGYLVVRAVAGLLTSLAAWSSPEARETPDRSTDADDKLDAAIYGVPGLHVVSDYGADHCFADQHPTEKTIRKTLRSLDWLGGFHQVILVTSPGVSFEVGGSLDPSDGLSSSYSDSQEGVFKVINEGPKSVAEMESLMVSFYRGDGRWERLNDYE